MSYLIRWTRQNQVLANRSASFLASQGIGTPNMLMGSHTIKPLYQTPAAPLTTTMPLSYNGPKREHHKKPDEGQPGGIKDNIEYTIKFKELDVKKIFKQFYSLYGPLFVASHIGVSLCSLGFFCSLVYLAIDITELIPSFMIEMMGKRAAGMTGVGSKFVAAYAVHKVLLPVRLFAAIWLTRMLSRTIQARKAIKMK